MKLIHRRESGYALAVVMFVLALWIPASLIQGYLKNAHMIKNLSKQISDTNLKWATESIANRAMFNLKNAIQNNGLDDCMFCPPTDANPLCGSSTPSGGGGCHVAGVETNSLEWFNDIDDTVPGVGFQQSFLNFLTPNSAYLASTVQSTEVLELSVRALENPSPASGVAVFDIGAKVKLSDQVGNLTSGINQQFRIRSSNIASFSIFLACGQDFVVSPGTNTRLEGPIYVCENAFLTPNKNTALTIACPDCDRNNPDPNMYALKTSGSIMWGGPVKIGQTPPTQNNATKPYETDVYGKPVRYQFLSNIDSGWTGFDTTPGIDGAEALKTSIIEVQDVHGTQASPQFTRLIGMNTATDPIRAPPIKFEFLRGPDQHVPPTTAHTPLANLNTAPSNTNVPANNVVVNTSLAYDSLNPELVAPFMSSENQIWRNFLDSHFRTSVTDIYFLEDKAALRTLQIGSANPRDLIEFASDSDNSILKNVKFQWVAFNAHRYDPNLPDPHIANSSSDFAGISLDFRKYGCTGSVCTDTTTIKGENPTNWGGANGFLNFPSVTYQDWRRGQFPIKIVELDVGALKDLIVLPDADPPSPNATYPFPRKPFVLYIGFDTNLSAPYHILNSVLRIKNAAELPVNGLTIATNGFVQIQGDYNITGTPPSHGPGSGDVCGMIPAAVVADQIMVLSNSWQDWTNSGPNAPASFEDPFVGPGTTFPAVDSNPNLTGIQPYPKHNFRSHVIYPNKNVTVNAVLVAGGLNEKLEPMDVASSLARSFDVNPLTGYSYGQLMLNNLVFPWTRFPYLRNRRLSQDNTGVCPFSPGIFPEVGTPPTAATNPECFDVSGITRIKSNNWRNTRVQIIDYEPPAGSCNGNSPCIIDLGPIGDVATAITIGSQTYKGFLYGCTSCNGMPGYTSAADLNDNIPLYIKVDENGRHVAPCNPDGFTPAGTVACDDPSVAGFLNTSVVSLETAHLITKVENVSGSWVVTSPDIVPVPNSPVSPSEYDYTQVKPGARFAAFARHTYDPAYPNNARRLIMPDSITLGCCTTSGGSTSCPYVCDGNPPGCSVGNIGSNCSYSTYCPSCAANICGGEGCTQSPQVNPSSLTCTGMGWQCPTATNGLGTCSTSCAVSGQSVPNPYPVIRYSKGGNTRQMAADPFSVTAMKFVYLPYYVQRYSGGFENMIRFGEDWVSWNCSGNPASCTPLTTSRSVELNGSVHKLWESVTLKKADNTSFAYWAPDTYTAPNRIFQYSSELKHEECVPPAMPRATPESEDLNVRRF